jgi:hypothetical protein
VGGPIAPEPRLHLPGIYIRYAADAMGSGTVCMDVSPSADRAAGSKRSAPDPGHGRAKLTVMKRARLLLMLAYRSDSLGLFTL